MTFPWMFLSRRDFPASIPLGYRWHILRGIVRRWFRRPPLPRNADGSVNVHVGCGNIAHPAFINVDIIPLPHIHYVSNAGNLGALTDAGVDLLYISHCLEHFPYARVPGVIAEWFRVLKQNAILRVSVPDFDLLFDAYRSLGNDLEPILPILMGGQDSPFNYHYTAFTRASLTKLLHDAGFREVRSWEPATSGLTEFNDWANRKAVLKGREFPISLNLEAVK